MSGVVNVLGNRNLRILDKSFIENQKESKYKFFVSYCHRLLDIF